MRRLVLAAMLALTATPMFAGCASAQEEIETIVVTGHLLTTAQESIFRKLDARLTPAGRHFVSQEAERVDDGVSTIEAAQNEAEYNCSASFGNCANDDAKALAFLVLADGLSRFGLHGMERMFDGIPITVLDKAIAKAQRHYEKGDTDGAARVWLGVLPPDRRPSFIRAIEQNKKIHAALDELTKEISQ